MSITYEVDPTLYEVERDDDTTFDWISNIGGLSFLSSIAMYVVSTADSPDTFVTSAMMDDGDVHKTR